MKQLTDKLRLIFLPLVIVAISFILIYTSLNWLLTIKSGMLSVKEDLVNVWVPIALSVIPVLIWIRPRLKLLSIKDDRASTLYYFAAILTIGIPTALTQQYLKTATGKLTSLHKISEYNSEKSTLYYNLDSCYLDKERIGIETTAEVSGKNNKDLTFRMFIVIPLLDNASDTVKGETSFFLGKKFSRTVSNDISDNAKEQEYQSFINQYQIEFDSTDYRRFTYLEKIGNTDDHDNYNQAVKKSPYVRYQDPVFFVAHEYSFENRSGDKFNWIFYSFGIGLGVWLVFLLFPRFDEGALKKLKKGEKEKDDSLKEMLSILIPREGFVVTPVIVNLNILIFVLMMFAGLGFLSFGAPDLLNWGATYGPKIQNGQWWRILTAMFLHGGVMHLVSNMFGLLVVGLFLEPFLRTQRILFTYILSGVVGSCVSLWWHPHVVGVGASGAIFGLYGTWLALLLFKVFPKEISRGFLITALIFIGYNLLMGLKGGIDNAAHIGGLIGGFLMGLIYTPFIKKEIAIEMETAIEVSPDSIDS